MEKSSMGRTRASLEKRNKKRAWLSRETKKILKMMREERARAVQSLVKENAHAQLFDESATHIETGTGRRRSTLVVDVVVSAGF
jgi:hypothetical protein